MANTTGIKHGGRQKGTPNRMTKELRSVYVTSGLLLDLNSKDCNSFSWTSTGNTLSTTWNDLSGNNNNFTTAGSPAYDINNGFVFGIGYP